VLGIKEAWRRGGDDILGEKVSGQEDTQKVTGDLQVR